MRIKNRLSPYPMLDNYGDDYVDSSFTVDYEVDTQFKEIYGKLSFKLDNKEILELIENNLAEYTVHIECPSTCYRNIIRATEPEIEFKLDTLDISRVIEIRTFIVLREDIKQFFSSKFHPDYAGQKFDLFAHQIIAIGTAMNYDVQKDDKDLDSLPSIIQIVKMKDTKRGSLSVNTDNDAYIIIGLTEEIYELYASLGKNTFKETIFSLVLIPALIVVLQRMHISRDDDAVNSMHWFQVIESMLESNGFELENLNIENESLLSICQSIFADPIARSFKELEKSSERMC